MAMIESEPLKDLDQLIEKGNLQIEKSKKITFKDRYMELVHRMSRTRYGSWSLPARPAMTC